MRCRVFFLLELLSPPPEKRRPPRRQLLKKTYQFPRNQTSQHRPYRLYRPYKRRPAPPLRLSKLVSKSVSKLPSRAKRKRSPLPTSMNRQKPSGKPNRARPKLPQQSRPPNRRNRLTKSPLPKQGAVSGSWRLPNFPMANTL